MANEPINDTTTLSVIIPAKNEVTGLNKILPRLRTLLPNAEIIVVDDGSTEPLTDLCHSYGAKCIVHPYNLGNGAAVKTGARAATGEVFIFMDADGQHDPDDIPRLVAGLRNGHKMVVGARGLDSQANIGRLTANVLYNWIASWMVGKPIADLTSGFRAVYAKRFREFLHLLPNGFSYPTTITMSFFRAGYAVGYVPIKASKRSGKSHIRPIKDGARFLLIIFKVGTLYSPLKLFAPISFFFFCLGLGYYIYTFLAFGRFTNMTALLLSTSVLIFLIGLVSEQITTLLYSRRD